MGTPVGLGMSESADTKTGGSNSVFLRRGKPYSVTRRCVRRPSVLLRRSDWYAHPGHPTSLDPPSWPLNHLLYPVLGQGSDLQRQ